MKDMWGKSKGKSTKGKNFPIKEKHENFPFPVKVKNTKISENFLVREKAGKIPRISEGRETLYIFYILFPFP